MGEGVRGEVVVQGLVMILEPPRVLWKFREHSGMLNF